MRPILKRSALLFLLAGLGAQLVPVERANPPIETEIPAPEPVRAALRRACYDCHSNETRWPWYAYVAPISWRVAGDVSDARKKLNFSTWNIYGARRRANRFKDIAKELHNGEMPLPGYLLLHPESHLSPSDATMLEEWATSSKAMLDAEVAAHVSPDGS